MIAEVKYRLNQNLFYIDDGTIKRLIVEGIETTTDNEKLCVKYKVKLENGNIELQDGQNLYESIKLAQRELDIENSEGFELSIRLLLKSWYYHYGKLNDASEDYDDRGHIVGMLESLSDCISSLQFKLDNQTK